jgi:hypothetical protein
MSQAAKQEIREQCAYDAEKRQLTECPALASWLMAYRKYRTGVWGSGHCGEGTVR